MFQVHPCGEASCVLQRPSTELPRRVEMEKQRPDDHIPYQSMLADPAIRSLPGRLGPEERRPEYSVGRGRGDCDAAALLPTKS